MATSETVLLCPNPETPPPCPDTKPTAPLLNPKAATSDSAVWGPQLKTTEMTVRGQQLTTRPDVSLVRLSSFWGSAKKKPDAGDEENADDWYATYCVGTCCDSCLGTCVIPAVWAHVTHSTRPGAFAAPPIVAALG